MNRPIGRPPQTPPLWLWPIVLGLVAGVFGITLETYLSDAVTGREADDRVNRKRIARFARERADHPRAVHVIGLGDSRLRNALPFDEQMEPYSREMGGPEIRFLRITRGNARLHEFLAIFDAILAAEPDLLIVQAWLLPHRTTELQQQLHHSYQQGEIPNFGISRKDHWKRLLHGRETLQHQAWMVDRLLTHFGTWIRSESQLDRRIITRQRKKVCLPARRDRFFARRERTYSADEEYDVDPSAAATVDLLVDQAAAVGTRLVFVDVPVESRISNLPGYRRKAARQEAFFASHADNPAFDRWDFDRSIPDSGFCDGIHLSQQGRSIFGSWFLTQVKAAVAEGEAQ